MSAIARTASISSAAAVRSAPIRAVPSTRAVGRLAARKTAGPKINRTATQASVVEVAQLAGEAGFIAQVSGTMMAMTLVGLAMGFVLLRVESLVEEGKL